MVILTLESPSRKIPLVHLHGELEGGKGDQELDVIVKYGTIPPSHGRPAPQNGPSKWGTLTGLRTIQSDFTPKESPCPDVLLRHHHVQEVFPFKNQAQAARPILTTTL